jgi:hypothetical protein
MKKEETFWSSKKRRLEERNEVKGGEKKQCTGIFGKIDASKINKKTKKYDYYMIVLKELRFNPGWIKRSELTKKIISTGELCTSVRAQLSFLEKGSITSGVTEDTIGLLYKKTDNLIYFKLNAGT